MELFWTRHSSEVCPCRLVSGTHLQGPACPTGQELSFLSGGYSLSSLSRIGVLSSRKLLDPMLMLDRRLATGREPLASHREPQQYLQFIKRANCCWSCRGGHLLVAAAQHPPEGSSVSLLRSRQKADKSERNRVLSAMMPRASIAHKFELESLRGSQVGRTEAKKK